MRTQWGVSIAALHHVLCHSCVIMLSHIVLVPGGHTEKGNVTVPSMFPPGRAEEERWWWWWGRESKYRYLHRAVRSLGKSTVSEHFSQEEIVLWRCWRESARTQLTLETFLIAPLTEFSRCQEVHCCLKNEKTKKCKQRSSKQKKQTSC